MIIDTLDQRHRYSGIPGLAEMLEALVALDDTAQPGTEIDLGEEIGSIGVAEFASVDPAVKIQFEAHRKFIDVHVVLAGEERINLAALDALTPATSFDEATDFGLHDGDASVSVTLRPGWFVVAFPSDAHLPGIWVNEPARVLKAVGKLRVP